MQDQKKEGANPGQLFRAFGPHHLHGKFKDKCWCDDELQEQSVGNSDEATSSDRSSNGENQ